MITSKRTYRAVVGTAVLSVGALSGTLIACTPEETSNKPRPAKATQPAPAPRPERTDRPWNRGGTPEGDREATRPPLKKVAHESTPMPVWVPERPVAAPDKPRSNPAPVRREPPVRTPKAPAKKKPAPTPSPAKPKAPAVQVTVIGSYVSCPVLPQRCIDKGKLTLYAGNKILAGHDWMGYAYLAQLPVGRTVRVTSGPVAGTYKVYGHQWINRKSGSIPGFVNNSALTLQSCQGSGTAFSLLKRVS